MRNLFTCFIAIIASFNTFAADMNARDFIAAPDGTVLSAYYLSYSHSTNFRGDGDTYKNAKATVTAFAFRQVLYTDLCGVICTPQFVIPYVDIDSRSPGQMGSGSGSGVGDPQIGGTLFLINNPNTQTYSGFMTLLTVPVGEYHSQSPDVSPGGNRWVLDLLYNFTQGLGERWVVEADLEALLFGKNNDYYGESLEQKPVFRLQTFLSYAFTDNTYGALRFIQGQGGEARFDGATLSDTEQKYTQLGVEIGHKLDQKNQFMLALTKDLDSSNTFQGAQALLRFVHVY
ncbi:transporter [Pseudomonas putida]|uniref:transporter n=1 Tax=Pseudomonas putida TaxID=303 RepID=UPI00157608CB|nr:transporter [Pseudomonas putida]NTY90395.1 transporter [Pseudomonas putida]NTY98937.1 transporter [Pseudomonas putida]NTZ21220.1 transporter [Pseudomonas putida]NTZ53261.1 transporter [Pseudomonas putida]NTZ65089.1 transporter [Pseudomonas putida]